MATNRTRVEGRQIAVTPTTGGLLSGDPLLCNQLPGVSINGGGLVSQVIDTRGVYNLSVKPTGAQATAGWIVYYKVGATPVLGDDATGVRFGIALTPVGIGVTASVDVRIGY